MKKFFLIFILVFSCSQKNELKELDEISKIIGFSYKIPDGCKVVKRLEQEDVFYYVGFQNKEGVEYRISAFDKDFAPPVHSDNEEDAMRALYMIAYSMVMNIANDTELEPKIMFFDKESVKNDFGADYGVTSAVKGNSDFSKGYKFVNINVMVKRGSGIIATFILANDIHEYSENVFTDDYLEQYYCVKFN